MFEVALITPTANRTVLVAWLECETSRGSLVIKEGHAPLVMALKPYSEIKFENEQGVVESLELSGGIAEVVRNSVTIILDQ